MARPACDAAKDADILFIEGITRKKISFASWGGDTEEEKVKNIVMVHVQNYNSPEDFDRLGVLKEMQDEGVMNILQAQDGDLY